MKLSDIKINPDNPRIIKDDKFKNLVKSLRELPVMTELREVILDENNMIIGGNMRYRASLEAGWKEIPTKTFTREMAYKNNELTNQEKSYEDYVREIIIKDNVSGGEWDWDSLANGWNTEDLGNWGIDLPTGWGSEDTVAEDIQKPDKKLHAVVVVAYEDLNDQDKITSLYELDCIDITDDIKDQLMSQKKMYVFKK